VPRRRRLLLATLLALLACVPPAAAFRLGPTAPAVPGNPADHLVALAPDPERYDPATHCDPRPKPGMTSLVGWLQHHSAGASWGIYRCERWGPHEASLHAEGRAVDWHLDHRDPRQRAAGERLIRLLLATDAAGTPHALARRMGVEELIWDCSYWGAGAADFSPYAPCFAGKGRRREHLDPTVGHLDHIHVGLSRAGAARRTSWWQQHA
jgi:hypothetical protein